MKKQLIALLMVFVLISSININLVNAQNEDEQVPPEDILINIAEYQPRVISAESLDQPKGTSGNSYYPVFALLYGIKTNPTIDVPVIESMSVRPDGLSSRFVGPIQYRRPSNNLFTLDNMGYLIIPIKRIPKENDVPKSIDLNLTARIVFFVSQGFGVNEQDLVLRELNEQDFILNKEKYNFWNGRGYLRLESLNDDGSAEISVYDSKINKVRSFRLEPGQTSNLIFLRSFYQSPNDLTIRDRLRVLFNKIVSGDDTAEIEMISDNKIKLVKAFQGEQLYPGSRYRIEKITRSSSRDEVVLKNVDTQERITLFKQQKSSVDCSISTTEDDCKVFGNKCQWSNDRCQSIELIQQPISVDKKIQSAEYEKRIKEAKEKYDDLVNLQKNVKSKVDSYNNKKETEIKNDLSKLSNGYFKLMNDYSDTQFFTLSWQKLFVDTSTIKSVYSLYNIIYQLSSNSEFKDLRDKLQNDAEKFKKILNSPTKTDTEVKGSNQYYLEAIKNYQNILDNYPDSKFYNTSSLIAVNAQRRIAEIYQFYLFDYEKAAEAYKNLLLNYIDDESVKSQEQQIRFWINVLENRQNYDLNYVSINEDGKLVNLVLSNINTAKEKARAYISVAGNEQEYKKGDKIGTLDLYVAKIDIARIVLNKESSGVSGSVTQEISLRLNEEKEISGALVRLNRVDTKKEIHLTVLPGEERTVSTSNFKVHIPVEGKLFKLSPEQIDSQIQTTQNIINSLDSIIDKVGTLHKVSTVYCYSVFSYLYLKNLFLGKKFVQAKKLVVDKWKDYCDEAVSRGAYRTRQNCLNENSDAISSDTSQAETIIGNLESNKELTDYQREVEIKRQLAIYAKDKNPELYNKYSTDYLNTARDALIQQQVNSDLEKIQKVFYDNNDKFIKDAELTGQEADTFSKIYPDEFIILNDRSKTVFERQKALEIILKKEADRRAYENSQAFLSQDNRNKLSKDLDEATVNNFYSKITNLPTLASDRGIEQISYEKIISLDGKQIFDVNNVNGVITTDKDGLNMASYRDVKNSIDKGNSLYLKIGANKLQEIQIVSKIESKDFIPRINLVDSGRDKGRLYRVSIDNSHYLEVKERDGTGSIKTLNIVRASEENQPLGAGNVLQEFKINECPQTLAQLIKAGEPGLKDSDGCRVLNDMEQNINKFINKPTTGDYISLRDKRYFIEKVISKTTSTECIDVNDPNDCKLLFGACDPVMCPSSRFDLNGNWKVDNVIQTGVAGSIILGLHNFELPYEPNPTCVTGIYAGLKNVKSIFVGYNECLQRQRVTGQSIGSCSYVRSLGICRVVWGTTTALFNVGGDRLLGFVGNKIVNKVQGGNEYVADFSENLKRSNQFFDFFTTTYGQSVFAAYRGGSTDEIGNTFCKAAIYGKLPGQGTFAEQLLRPSVPPQFTALLEESSHSDITGEDISDYRIWYNIYAGENRDIRYIVLLKNNKGDERAVTYLSSLERGRTKDESLIVTYESGFNEICVRIDGQAERCGFGKVSTEFAINYAQEQATRQEFKRSDIETANECVPRTGTVVDNPGLVKTPLDIFNSGITQTGVVRKCSAINPGKGIGEESRWVKRGECGKDDQGRDLGTCWLDTSSVRFQDERNKELLSNEVNVYLENLKNNEEISEQFSKIKNNLFVLNNKFSNDLKRKDTNELKEDEKSYLALIKQYQELQQQTLDNDWNGRIFWEIGTVYDKLGYLKSKIEGFESPAITKRISARNVWSFTNIKDGIEVQLTGTDIKILHKETVRTTNLVTGTVRSGQYLFHVSKSGQKIDCVKSFIDFFKDPLSFSYTQRANLPSSKTCYGYPRLSIKLDSVKEDNIDFTVKIVGEVDSATLKRIEQYSSIIEEAADDFGVEPNLIRAVITQESQGKVEVVSKTGCEGLMQLCKDTVTQIEKEFGIEKRNIDPKNPKDNIEGGTYILARYTYIFNDYSDKTIFGLASYNGGYGVIQNAIRLTNKNDPSWEEVSEKITANLLNEFKDYSKLSQNQRKQKASEITEYPILVLAYKQFYDEKYSEKLIAQQTTSSSIEETVAVIPDNLEDVVT